MYWNLFYHFTIVQFVLILSFVDFSATILRTLRVKPQVSCLTAKKKCQTFQSKILLNYAIRSRAFTMHFFTLVSSYYPIYPLSYFLSSYAAGKTFIEAKNPFCLSREFHTFLMGLQKKESSFFFASCTFMFISPWQDDNIETGRKVPDVSKV